MVAWRWLAWRKALVRTSVAALGYPLQRCSSGGPRKAESRSPGTLAGAVRTSLCWLDAASARLEEFLPLPSGGDSSYAGLAWHDRRLWVSYYSSHEKKTSIYLDTVAID